MEKIIRKLLIVGCGRLGQRIGKDLSKLPIEIIGIKRQLSKLKFSLKHSNYKSGYHQMITKLNKTNEQNID